MTFVPRSIALGCAVLPLLGWGQLADLVPGGAYPSKEDILSIPWEDTLVMPKGLKLPTAWDLSKWFPPAGDQYAQASCCGWALGYGLSTYQWNQKRERPSDPIYLKDPANVFSPAFVYNLVAMQEQID